jgi:uncharacterized cupredoxin-like copper-binding protein
MNTVTYRTATAAAALLSVALLTAGCSSSKGGGYGAGGAVTSSNGSTAASSSTAGGRYGSAPSSSASKGGAAAVGTAVTANEQEFSITLSAKTFKAGAYTFTVHNAGKYPHNLTIQGPGVDKAASPTTPGGGTGTVSVTLTKGSYELWCSVDSHKDKGMDMTITVT